MTNQTRAVIARGARDLVINEVAVPELGPDDVLVRVQTGGICGSDLHYYNHGGFGTVRIKSPMVLGHEAAGDVVACGSAVNEIRPSDRVAINPSLPCGKCSRCRRGEINHCSDMRFMGSAMRTPHVHGAFRDLLVCKASQVHRIPVSMSYGTAALAEPTAVCLHALSRAGSLVGKRVLVTGAGPIGLILVSASRLAGAAHIAVTDRLTAPLKTALEIGADRAINVGGEEELAPGPGDQPYDVHFEASGNGQALLAGIAALSPLGCSVLVGQGAVVNLQVSSLVTTETQLLGSFRFGEEFATAIDYIASGRLPVASLISATLPAADALAAFELANDKSQSIKVQIDFS